MPRPGHSRRPRRARRPSPSSMRVTRGVIARHRPVQGGARHRRTSLRMSVVSSPVGTLLSGRYRLDAQIGAGGMSTVYKAFDTVLERPVAIKLMHRELASASDQLERFRREARSVAQLNHPHIVTVIDAG